MYFWDVGGFRRLGNGDGGREVLAVLVIIGLFVALYWLYQKVERVAEEFTRNLAHVVLDVHSSD